MYLSKLVSYSGEAELSLDALQQVAEVHDCCVWFYCSSLQNVSTPIGKPLHKLNSYHPLYLRL